MFILTLIIVFTCLWVYFGVKRTPEEKRDERKQYLGEEFANEQYYKDLARKQINQEDKEARDAKPLNMWLPAKQGYTLPDRVAQRAQELKLQDKNK